MVELSREQFLNQKRDYSEFLVHLTRSTDNSSARQVLLQILGSRTVEANAAYGLFMYNLGELPESMRADFSVACFTECPLAFVRGIVAEVSREKPLEPYGIFVTKDVLVGAGGNPVLYVGGDAITGLKENWKLLIRAEEWGVIRDVMPFVSKFDEEIDFHWEREWRVPGGLPISPESVPFIVCVEEDIAWLRRELARGWQRDWLSVPIVDATWSPERMVEEVAKHARKREA